jgi:ornithine cyclodeaminase/alanine dehydrogenase-like protein (mu-crystallin family)
MEFLDADAVHRAMAYPALIAALRRAHLRPPPYVHESTIAEPGAGRERFFLSLTAWERDRAIGVKLLSVFPNNSPHPSNQGLYIVFDAQSGAPILVADATALTLRKTAADSALGLELLARPDVETMLMIGAGALAPHVIRAFIGVRPSIKHIRVWNRTPERARRIVEQMSDSNIRIETTEQLESALGWADVVSSATMSESPLVAGTLLKPGSHIDLIGGWRKNMREADDDTVRRAALFSDSITACQECGDISQPLEHGVISISDIRGDLFDICSAKIPGRTTQEQVTLFKNAGGAHLDFFAAEFLIKSLRDANAP